MSLYSTIEQKFQRPDLGLFILRIVFGLLIIIFGLQKLLAGGPMFEQIGGALATFGITWQPKLWGLLAALTETFGGLCVLLGCFTRPATFLLSFNMLVASVANYQMTGAADTSSMGAFVEWMGKVAVPVYFLAVFLTLFFTGPGKYAICKSGGGRSKSRSGSEG